MSDLILKAFHIGLDYSRLVRTANVAPVAPVRKWEAENVVGGQGPYVRGLRGEDSRVYFQDLSPEVQDAP